MRAYTPAHMIPNTKPNPLWSAAREMVSFFVLAIGGPNIIATMGKLSRQMRRDIFGLAGAARAHRQEAVADRSGNLPLPADGLGPPALTSARLKSYMNRPHRPRAWGDPEKPRTWRASFAVRIPSVEKRRAPVNSGPRIRSFDAPTPAPKQRARRRDPAFAFALRFEAVRRVLDDPARAIVRLARRLCRDAAAAFRLATTRKPRRHRGFADEAIRAATEEAVNAAARLSDTS